MQSFPSTQSYLIYFFEQINFKKLIVLRFFHRFIPSCFKTFIQVYFYRHIKPKNIAVKDYLAIQGRFKHLTNDQIEKLYAEKESMQLYKDIVNENNSENLARVFTDIRYKKDDNVLFSSSLLKVLEKQGFMNHQ